MGPRKVSNHLASRHSHASRECGYCFILLKFFVISALQKKKKKANIIILRISFTDLFCEQEPCSLSLHLLISVTFSARADAQALENRNVGLDSHANAVLRDASNKGNYLAST